MDGLRSVIPMSMNMILVGNKKDRISSSFDASPLYQWAEKNKMPYLMTSAKTGEGINELFRNIGILCLQHKGEVMDDSYPSQSLGYENTNAHSCC